MNQEHPVSQTRAYTPPTAEPLNGLRDLLAALLDLQGELLANT